ncbi:hypothetical protein DENSPDRAFT_835654 [Dentipellis sp. KUC8613]|nr:hypothetical protein DENSPDRAFT_835654 [Dentipellis sp. KUC8613]
MNSPLEPASPSSTASSDSLPDENIPSYSLSMPAPAPSSGPGLFQASAKRRLGHASGARDPKSRRREDVIARKGPWVDPREDGIPRRQKEEFIDVPLTEALKKKIGDPFDEDIIKNAS